MSADASSDKPAKRPRPLAKNFRWQAFFERCAEPLFVLNRRRRLLYVNPAWETLTGVPKEQAHLLVCRRPQSVSIEDSPEVVLTHALTPPREVLHGDSGHVRRFLPGSTPRWWEIEFLPLAQQGTQGGHLIVGRIRPLPAVEQHNDQPLSEKLVNLRQHRVERFGLEAWSSPLPAMRRLLTQVRLASQVAVPVLLVGEPGSGKHTLARTIHYHSRRRDDALAALDCRYLPPAAIASLLFSHDRRDGGPSGREGVAAMYLREPAHLPRDVQLLLCERITRAGDPHSESANGPRIFAGSRLPLAEAVRQGRMIEELAYALSTLVLDVPPLRERQADLTVLVEHLLERACFGSGTRVVSLSAEAWALLRGYTWPGNVRQLYDVLRAACARASGEQLRAADLPAELRRAVERERLPSRPVDQSLPLEQLLEEAERRLIQLALQRSHGRKARAARLLGVPRPRLWRRMLKLGIADPEKDADGSGADALEE